MIRAFAITVAWGVVLSTLSGCGVVPPQVQYQEYVAGADARSGFPMRHRRSILLVKFDPKQNAFTAEAAPYELDVGGTNYLPLFQIAGLDDWKATTQLKVTYLDNTKIVDTMELTTKDNVADTINKIGDVAAALAPVVGGLVAGGGPVAAANPFKDTTLDPAAAKPGEWQPDEINSNLCMKLSGAATEQGMPFVDYMKTRQSSARDFPVSSCVSAVLAIAKCDEPKRDDVAQKLRVVYASADRVTPIPLPSSGSVKMNSVCGAAVTEADKQDRRALSTYLTTLMDNVKKVEAAKKK